MTPTPEQIAAGLTEAQKGAVRGAMETLLTKQYLLSSKLHFRVAQNLMNIGLAICHDPYRLRLTPLGLAVRAVLERGDG